MPELPEVETMRLQLEKFLVGHTIESVKILNSKFQIPNEKLIGAKIIGVRRFAKVTSIDLDDGYSILTHVKLTGQYIYRGVNLKGDVSLSRKVVGGVPGPHTHVIFNLDEGSALYYNDIRKFGWIRIVKRQDVKGESFIKKLGPEPMIGLRNSGLPALTLDEFVRILSKTSRAIKVVLMDQTKIGGVGNIYANDALWLSGIDPKRKANSLQTTETQELFKAIYTVLKAGLKYGGASELAFVTPDGREGEYQNHSLVYGHQGKICTRCRKNTIEKYFLGGRGTYWCSNCQK
jgi:formamidopyrimidine-DNA glycosylase